MIVIELFKL